ncbi:hypothetical protein B9G55_10255 [Saccharibacillus sp. O16]|nr:hypothetical protein B9G55_10255 [Saccharibacillus sp. O16]
MQRVWTKMGKDEKGFTLIELLAVLVIIAIIAVIAIPLIGNIINKSRESGDLSAASQMYNAARMYVIDKNNGDFTKESPITLKMLVDGKYIDANLVLPSSKVALDPAKATVTFDTTSGALTEVNLYTTKDNTFTAKQVLSATK